MSKTVKCPKCNVAIEWKTTNDPKVKKGKCPNCGMGFTQMGGTIISDIKYSKKK